MSDTRHASCWTVALTGGIAAGKSAVSRYFEDCGVSVHDADQGAREAVAPGTPGLAAIVETFGKNVLQPDHSLDRTVLRQRVFADAQARRQLEAIVHPRVDTWLHERVRHENRSWCMLAIPLLAETWPRYEWVDRVLVVEATVALRITRLTRRDGIDTQAARRMIDAQASDAARQSLADDTIDNNGDLASLASQVEHLCRRYHTLASQRHDRRRE